MGVHEDRNGFFLPLVVNYCRIIAKNSWLPHFGVLVLNHSSNNTVLLSLKNSVSGGASVYGIF